MKREYELTKLPDAEIRRRLEIPIKNNNHDAQIERLQLMREKAFRNRWTRPPTRRPWTALADEAPPEDEPVLWWAPGKFVCGTFEGGSVFVASYSATEREDGNERSKWEMTEFGGYAVDSFPRNTPTHWRPLPATR